MSNGYVAIPKTMRKFSEEKYGISHGRIAILISWIVLSLALIILAGLSGIIGKAVFISLLVAIWMIYGFFLRTEDVLNRSILTGKYTLRAMRGETVIAKYTPQIGFLQQIVPIREFHPNGLIEFNDMRFGLLLKIDPERVADDDLEGHVHKVKDAVDALHGDLMIKTFACSRSTMIKPLEKNLIENLKDDKTQAQKEHIYELYNEVHKNTVPVIEWQFYVFLGLGMQPTLEDAEVSRQAHYPGFYDRMIKAGMHVIPILNRDEVVLTFRQCFTQEKIL